MSYWSYRSYFRLRFFRSLACASAVPMQTPGRVLGGPVGRVGRVRRVGRCVVWSCAHTLVAVRKSAHVMACPPSPRLRRVTRPSRPNCPTGPTGPTFACVSVDQPRVRQHFFRFPGCKIFPPGLLFAKTCKQLTVSGGGNGIGRRAELSALRRGAGEGTL